MTSNPDNAGFYAALEPFAEFNEVLDFSAYRPVPDNWVVMAGDIANSTHAIAEGQYKAVNLVGAAVITAVLNACPGLELPFSFGGDGGLILVPESSAGPASSALRGLQVQADQFFDLQLRCAAVPVRRLRLEGHDVLVRKLLLNRRNTLAMFAGTGLAHVDSIMKSGAPDDPDVLHPAADTPPPDLEGLSCRWEPLEARRSGMMALMVLPAPGTDGAAVLGEVLARLNRLLEGGVPAHAPVSDHTLRFRWPPGGLPLERRLLAPVRGRMSAWIWTLFTSLAQKWSHLRGAKIGDYNGPAYQREVEAQTDFRKFDGCLRTVLDCTDAEIAGIRTFLDDARQHGRLAYGMHVDRQALMTCLVFSLKESRHLHFIDAAGGGFAKAAEQLKAQLAAWE